jgi:hypothetical protein
MACLQMEQSIKKTSNGTFQCVRWVTFALSAGRRWRVPRAFA